MSGEALTSDDREVILADTTKKCRGYELSRVSDIGILVTGVS